MAVLQVFDDGLKSSDSVRVRTTPFVIGREEGDLVLPHDRLISTRHAAIEHTLAASRPQWSLRDLGSANGTFVQAKQSLLEPGREIAIARQRFRFCAPESQTDDSEEREPESDVRRTMSWSSLMKRRKPEAAPFFVEAMPDREGRRFPLSKSEQWIGRARDCAVLLDDPTVSPRHARVFKARDGKWYVEDANSLNGLWVRIASLPLSTGAFFLLGEQVFMITFP
jgi:pSer/pThr/pTyr-binding forkhead associated (FHA) protein